MRNIWRIFVEDLKSLKSNVIALVVVVGLIITPVLYAWFNILGFWDPYSATDNLEVAVANADAGYTSSLFPTKVNAGEEIVAGLRANQEFKWVFTEENDAIDGVKSGKYYAALVIPESFSADLLTIFSGEVKHADIVYYTNQKENAVAPKVTDEGANSVSVAINQAFTKTVASVAIGTTSDLMNFVNGDGVANYGRNLDQHLETIIADLNLAADEATAFANLVDSTEAVAGSSSEVLGGLSDFGESVGPLLDQAEGGFKEGAQAFDTASGELDALLGQLGTLEQTVEKALGGLGGEESNKTQEIKQKLTAAKEALNQLVQHYREKLAIETDQLEGTLTNAKTTILTINNQLEDTARRMSETTGTLAGDLREIGGSLESTANTLTGAAMRLTGVRERLQAALDSRDLAKVREIIGSNPEGMAEFISAPTVLDKIPVYGVANNGSAFSPFYTSLAIWVGSVFLVALMETEVGKKRLAELEYAKPHELYLGRFLTFLAFALVQATIVCAGDVCFLGIQCEHVGLFFVTGWVCALVFSCIVYTLTLSFNKVGECLAIILLVLQIAGSGGIFPVVLSAEFFQVLYPFLPFTYSLQAFQGAVAGVYGDQYWSSIGMMLAFLIPMLFIGLVLRKPIIALNSKLTSKIGESKVL